MQNKYVALLRGMNVGGNGMISMAKLKVSFEMLGFGNVRTYINSGNILFVSAEKHTKKLEKKIEGMIAEDYGMKIKVMVRSLKQLEALVKVLATKLKDEKDWKHNVIFLSSKIDSKNILKELQVKKGIEELLYIPGALIWSARHDSLTKSEMLKLSRKPIYQEMTVRNTNTPKKLYELLKNINLENK